MGHRVFLSYSTKDHAAAEAICKALEAAGIRCWIAPRDIVAGQQWGGSIVSAVESSEAVVVVFSEHANASPQVTREMEIAVAKRLPLIPVRVADVMPTEDMQYFLGVSHWFNAYPKPLGSYLPQIVESVRRVLASPGGAWRKSVTRLPGGRVGQIGLGALGAALIAAVVAYAMRPAPVAAPGQPDFAAQFASPLEGRWQASIADAQGRKQDCIFDVQQMGQAAFSDICPMPFTGAHAALNALKDGTWAPQVFKPGDDGTVLFQGGTLHGFAEAYRKVGANSLMTRDAQHGEIVWSKISADAPVPDASRDIVPAGSQWPLKDMPGIARRATAYARSHWKSDAVLMGLQAKLNPGGNVQTLAGTVELRFEYYSPDTQEGLQLMPGDRSGGLFPLGAIDRNPRRALPDNFLDLPEAVAQLHARGMRGKQIANAQLENWASGTSYGSVNLNGLQWMIDSALDERATVPATVR